MRSVLVEGGIDEDIADRLIAAHPEHADAPHLLLGDVISDTIFHCQLASWLLARDAHAVGTGEADGVRPGGALGTTTSGEVRAGSWAFEFSYTGGQMGMATHCMDLPFTFDCLLDPYCAGHTLPGTR